MEDSKKGYIMKQVFGQKELHEREAICTQQQPPNCMTTCPIHLDVCGICDALKNQDFSKGRSIIEKSTSFAHIIAYACEAPCEAGCKLNEQGQGIQIRELERACLRFGTNQTRPRFLLPKKSSKVAILGADMFCLSAAMEIGKKGYPIKLVSEGDNLISQLGAFHFKIPEADLKADLSMFHCLEAEFCFGEVINLEMLTSMLEQFDAICISQELFKRIIPNQSIINEETLETDIEKLFAGLPDSSVIGQLSIGKKAAISIDRFIQKVSIKVGREQEGSYQTTLFTSLEEVEQSKRIVPSGDAYTKEEAILEAKRCIHCECLECVKGCAFMQHYNKYPKQAIREIYNNLAIVMGNHLANDMINSCSLCGQCKAICPNDFDLGEVCKLARQTMIKTEKMPQSTYEFALLDMAFSNSDKCFLAKHQPDWNKSAYVFFPGCQMGASAPETVRKVYMDLTRRLSGGVSLMLGCCGAIADWSGQQELFEESIQKLMLEWEKLGKPKVITACPSCYRVLSEASNMKLVGIWEILEEIGLPDNVRIRQEGGEVLAIHDACGARNQEAIQNSIRNLVTKMGYETVELPFSGDTAPCCGFGGLTSFTNQEVAKRMTDLCIGQSDASYLTYCMNCRDRFVKQGKNARHILELIYGENPQVSPDLSKRHYNRMILKQTLLQEVWGEEGMKQTYNFQLVIEEEIRNQMEERMILESDIMEVLDFARKSHNIIRDTQTQLLLTNQRIGNVTFWIKYKEVADNVYQIYSAYSLRMTVEEE
ncbi:Fe-S oxidoreductase [Lachnotalea glycerini]|uniref:Fe-S oxidoreductase n=1 Tax=Lachnotalea glycerini TaxID=1763509 RepID=A0A318EPM5_9FIRM|nr:pyridine nucleotide-disulfide oxidoreductase/dicluster-binding protein [Lachnotalea glycerini]PXV93425.1 Fe-S oxidoreductase [Lachnotalea glycerini]